MDFSHVSNVTPFPLKAAPRTTLHPLVQSAVDEVDAAVMTFFEAIRYATDPSDVHRIAREMERLGLTLAAGAGFAREKEESLCNGRAV